MAGLAGPGRTSPVLELEAMLKDLPHTYLLSAGAHVLSASAVLRRCLGVPCAERPVLPSAAHSRFQLAPTAPPQGIAEAPSQDGGTPGSGNPLCTGRRARTEHKNGEK